MEETEPLSGGRRVSHLRHVQPASISARRPTASVEYARTPGPASTGKWEGTKLTVETTHIKTGWIQRNGAATSDLATMTEHFIRHGDNLLIVTIVNDPVYLAEPFIRTSNWVLSLNQQVNSFGACGPAGDEVSVPRGYVSHHLPGTNDQVKPFLEAHKAPAEGVAGGADTTYPEYMKRIRQPDTPRPTVALSPSQPVHRQPVTIGDIETMKVQENVYLLATAAGNIVAQVGEDGVLLVDSGAGRAPTGHRSGDAQRQPIHYPNTSADPDRTGGNKRLAAGNRICTQMVAAGREGAAILAHRKC